ncbi:MAG: CocE/NonD family hydrolase [Acidobacteria bacterium]|nr:MAG: CocE/NonD family hydrolase [Acidobacteriota bacterium]
MPRSSRLLLAVATVATLVALAVALPASAQIHRVSDAVRQADLDREAEVLRMIQVPMRDGVRLATEVYLPRERSGPVPAVFWRTPYNFSRLAPSNPARPNARLKYALDAIRNGYAFVTQNERGKFFSEGDWEILGHPRTDGWDALDWIAAQPWSSGRVATLGCSSTAEWQMALAEMDHPAHAAAVPMGQGAGIGRMGPYFEQGNFYRGGAIQLPMVVWLFGEQIAPRPTFPRDTPRNELERIARWFDLAADVPDVDWSSALRELPVVSMMERSGGDPGFFAEAVRRRPDDPAWYEGGLYHDDAGFGVPALWVNSWYDLGVSPNLELYRHVRAKAAEDVRQHQYMVVAPTLHCAQYRLTDPLVVGEREMGDWEEVDFGFDEIVFSFLDRFTKAQDEAKNRAYDEQTPKVRYFMMGTEEPGGSPDRGWRVAETWPPPHRQRTLYLGSGERGANSLHGDGVLLADPSADAAAADRFTYDPSSPVPTRGGNFCCLGGEPEGAFDQRPVEARADVLVYTSEPFSEPLQVAGFVEVVLFVSSDARDTDFTVKLLDVLPDGRAFNLDDAILRARYREGFDREAFLEEGEVYELRLGPLSTANRFAAGHRLRVEVSSSNFPRYDRNLNTGGNNWDETQGVVANNVVHHSAEHPSRIVLPVLQE